MIVLSFAQITDLFREYFGRCFLVLKCFEIQGILSSSQCDTSCFMVGSYHNQSFFRVFLVKLISNFDGIIHIRHFVEHRSGIIPVTSPVYLTPFYHQKETFVFAFSQKVNSAFCNLCQSQVSFFTIDSIRQRARIGTFFLNQYHLTCRSSFGFIIVIPTSNGVTGFFKHRENARSFFLIISSGWFQETGTGIKIKTCFRKIGSYFIIHIPIRLMCVESSRSSMIDTDTGSNSHPFTGFLCFLGNCLQRILLIIHPNGTIISLFAGGKSSSRSRRISHGISGRERSSHCPHRELCKKQRLYTNAALLDFGTIHFRTIHLIDTHSITNEIENIFCLSIGYNCHTDKKKEIKKSFHSCTILSLFELVIAKIKILKRRKGERDMNILLNRSPSINYPSTQTAISNLPHIKKPENRE